MAEDAADEDELLYDDLNEDDLGEEEVPVVQEGAKAGEDDPAGAAATATATPPTDAGGDPPSAAPATAISESLAVAAAADPNAPTGVIISGLSWWTTDVEVEEYCSEYGAVKSLTFTTDVLNGKSKGIVRVDFDDGAAAGDAARAAAMCYEKLPYKRINGRDINVKFAPKMTESSATQPPLPAGKPPDTRWRGAVPGQASGQYGGGFMNMNPAMRQQMMMQMQMGAAMNMMGGMVGHMGGMGGHMGGRGGRGPPPGGRGGRGGGKRPRH